MAGDCHRARPAFLFQCGAEVEVFALLLITFTFGGVIVAGLPAHWPGLRKVLVFVME